MHFDGLGNIESVYDKGTAQTIGIQQEYLYYVGNTGDAVDGQQSGAYPFILSPFLFFNTLYLFISFT